MSHRTRGQVGIGKRNEFRGQALMSVEPCKGSGRQLHGQLDGALFGDALVEHIAERIKTCPQPALGRPQADHAPGLLGTDPLGDGGMEKIQPGAGSRHSHTATGRPWASRSMRGVTPRASILL